MRSLTFKDNSWFDAEELRTRDSKTHRVFVRILKELTRGNPATGAGKPEKLKHELSGLWSRRLSKKDRLVYAFDDETIYIYAVGGHYDL